MLSFEMAKYYVRNVKWPFLESLHFAHKFKIFFSNCSAEHLKEILMYLPPSIEFNYIIIMVSLAILNLRYF